MAFTVDEKVIAQLRGGTTGTKNISPMLPGVIKTINGAKITVTFDRKVAQVAESYFPGNVVDETCLSHA